MTWRAGARTCASSEGDGWGNAKRCCHRAFLSWLPSWPLPRACIARNFPRSTPPARTLAASRSSLSSSPIRLRVRCGSCLASRRECQCISPRRRRPCRNPSSVRSPTIASRFVAGMDRSNSGEDAFTHASVVGFDRASVPALYLMQLRFLPPRPAGEPVFGRRDGGPRFFGWFMRQT